MRLIWHSVLRQSWNEQRSRETVFQEDQLVICEIRAIERWSRGYWNLRWQSDGRRQHVSFDEEYFRKLRYSQKERLIRRHIRDVLEWGARISDSDLLSGAGKKALDVGCAYGYAVDILRSLGYSACGVDISRHGVKEAKKSHPADFIVCDVQSGLPFYKDAFDLVTCFGVLEHLNCPLKALKNMYASCRGILVCTTPNRLVEKPFKEIIRDMDETHINVKSQEEWEDLLSENLDSNFKVESVLDASFRVKDKLLFFKSLRVPYLGLDLRILVNKKDHRRLGNRRSCPNHRQSVA